MRPKYLIYHVLSGYATEQEKSQLETWKNLSAENMAEFENIKRLWDDASFEQDPGFDAEQDLNDLRKKMFRWRRRRKIRQIIVIALGTIIVAALLYCFFYQLGKQDLPSVLEP